MNIITETIAWLQGLGRERIVEVNDLKYLDTTVANLQPITEPVHPSLNCDLTLTGLVDYINENPDGITYDAFVVVENYKSILFMTAPVGDFNSRYLLAQAQHSSWYRLDGAERGALRAGVESMIVTLLTCFEPTEDREYLVDLISNIKIDDETRIEDDGLTQKVAVKTGITTVEQQDVKRMLTLRPRLTFPEIRQPDIVYTVRLKQEGPNTVKVHLFPQEDIAWQGEIADRIQTHLTINAQQPIKVIR